MSTAADTGTPAPARRVVPWTRVVLGVVMAAAVLYAPFYYRPEMNLLLSQAIYLAIAAMGLNLLTGFNGQISIGHGAFFAVGAFTTAILMVDHSWPFELTLVAAAVVTGVIGMLVGIPALRVRGLYLALVTLGLAVAVQPVLAKLSTDDLVQPKSKQFASLLTFLKDDQWQYFECLLIAVLLFVAARNIVKSRIGRAMIATRDQELAAATVGVDLARVKVATFAISAAYAGVAGALSVMIDGGADATNPLIYLQKSIEFLVAVVIGGSATIMGPAVGAFLILFLRRNTEDLIEGKEVLAPAVFGAALILIVYFVPDGAVGGVNRLIARFSRRSAPPPEPPAAPAPAVASAPGPASIPPSHPTDPGDTP